MSIASLYPSINPSLLLDFANSKVLDPRITFSRTTTATYYDGVTTAKAEENLFTYSQEFDNAAWSKALVTITSNATTAPDGTSTADLAVANTTNGDHSVVQSFTFPADTTLTISCYMKAAGYDYGVIRHYSAGNGDVWASFNLSTGAVDSNSSGVTASITSVGSSWYRCVMTKTYSSATSGNSYGIRVANAGGIGTPFAGNGTSGIYIWGAQLEQRSSATAYTATTTQAITNYIPVLQTASAGQARFDHNPTTGESLGLLIEEARTNSLTYSEDLSNAAWTVDSGGTLVVNQAVSPAGTLTADFMREGTSSAAPRLSRTSPFNPSGSAFTYSIYVKSYGTKRNIFLLAQEASNAFYAHFDIVAGTVVQSAGSGTGTLSNASIQSVGNGWFRISISGSISGSTSVYVIANLEAVGTTGFGAGAYTGDGFSGGFFWGAQLETSGSSFATSYIPTVASTVTRNADAASMTGTNFSSWFNYGAMTIYAEATGYEAGSYDIIDLDSGSNTGRIRTRFASDYQVDQLDASVAQTFSLDGGSVTAKSFAKIAAGLTQNSQALSLNGGSVATATAPFTTQPAPTTARIGSNFAGSNYLNGTIKKIAFYPVKATNAQLQALTV